MEAWERPVANMAGKSLGYANMPRALLGIDDVTKIDELLANNNVFIPFFENNAAGPNTFDLAGRMIPADVALSGYADVFESIAETGSEAASTLATMGRGDEDTEDADTSPFVLSAHWLEYTFIKPNGEETTYRRDLLDRIGKSARVDGDQMPVEKMGKQELNTALTSFQSFMVAVGRFPDAYLLDRSIERLMGMRSTISLVIQGKTDPGASAEPHSDDASSSYPFSLAQLAFYSHVDHQTEPENASVNYRGEPSLVVQSKRMSGDNRSTSTFDIITNKRRTFEQNGEQLSQVPAQAVLAGAMETRAETFLHPDRGSRTRTVLNTVGVFEEAIDAGIAVKVLRPGSMELLETLAVSEATRRHIRNDLESGYVLILPEKSPRANPDYFAWWRVNPATGETLGIISRGLGGDFLEELANQSLIMQMGIVMGIAGGVTGFVICAAQASRDYTAAQTGACCFFDAVVGGGVAFFAGAVVGAWVGALMGFVLMDIIGTAAITTGSVMGLIPSFCG